MSGSLRMLRALLGDPGASSALRALEATRRTGREHSAGSTAPGRLVRGDEWHVEVPEWVPPNAAWLYHTHPEGGGGQFPSPSDLRVWAGRRHFQDAVLAPYAYPGMAPSRDFSVHSLSRPRYRIGLDALDDIAKAAEQAADDRELGSLWEGGVSGPLDYYLQPSDFAGWLAARRAADSAGAELTSRAPVALPGRGYERRGYDAAPHMETFYGLAKRRGFRHGGAVGPRP